MKLSASVFSISVLLAGFAFFSGTATAATPQVVVGDSATCFLADSGAVTCQGANGAGQLAQPNTVTSSTTPLPVTIGPVEQIEAGDEHFCALLPGGTVACWGSSSSGQAGNASFDPAYAPNPIAGITGAVALTSLDDDVCAQFADGSVKCWGNNSGQFGGAHLAVTKTAVPLDIPGFLGSRGAANGDDVLCAIFNNAVRCQGDNGDGEAGQPLATTYVSQPTEVAGTAGAIQVSAGENFTCALIGPAGTVKCWGDGSDGRLGIGATDQTSKASPVDVLGLSDIVKIKLGEEHACALRRDGAVFCWGESSLGQSGQAADFVTPPAQVAIGAAAADIEVGYDGACALLRGGGVSCWGSNDEGGFGAPTDNVLSPKLMAGVDLVTLPQAAQGAKLSLTGKSKLDRKRKNYSRSARLTVTPSAYVVLADACAGTARATTSYKYKAWKTKRVRGKKKRVRVTKTKKFSAKGTLTTVGNDCVANFTLKKLPVRYFAGKKRTVTATVAANAGLQAVSAKTSMKLPKVKKKRK